MITIPKVIQKSYDSVQEFIKNEPFILRFASKEQDNFLSFIVFYRTPNADLMDVGILKIAQSTFVEDLEGSDVKLNDYVKQNPHLVSAI